MVGTPISREFIAGKISEIKKTGVRRNTHAPVSAENPRRQVSQAQRVAIALNAAREKGFKIPVARKK